MKKEGLLNKIKYLEEQAKENQRRRPYPCDNYLRLEGYLEAIKAVKYLINEEKEENQWTDYELQIKK